MASAVCMLVCLYCTLVLAKGFKNKYNQVIGTLMGMAGQHNGRGYVTMVTCTNMPVPLSIPMQKMPCLAVKREHASLCQFCKNVLSLSITKIPMFLWLSLLFNSAGVQSELIFGSMK